MNLISNLKVLLVLMIGYDWSLHLVALFNVRSIHPLYPHFPLFNYSISYYGLPFITPSISYEVFWTTFWGIAFLFALIILLVKE